MRLYVLLAAAALLQAQPAAVKIVKQGDGFQLLRNGKPYFVKGAAGGRYLDRLAAAGGNSIRTYGDPAALDAAARQGLTALVGLNVGKPRQGFDYGDAAKVAAQRARVRETVLKLRDHPALLMWALGNENELAAPDADRIRVWKAVNDLAVMVKELDPNHPVITVIAGLGKANLVELSEYCPALDAVGINAYGGMLRLAEGIARQGWKKPYLVTEFGPRGHWEVAKTAWGLPLEDSSTEKAEFYLKAYRAAVDGQPLCLGSYVFLWGQKQEKTHTWYGMFLPDGSPLGAVDAMTYAWTGRWPANRCPRISQVRVTGETRPGARLECAVEASDPDADPLRVEWDLRADVSDAPQRGGDREPPSEPIAGAVEAHGTGAAITLPAKPGNYRIFVYARDPKGSAATANVPVQAR